MHGRKGFLPEQPDGQGQIHHDPTFNDTTRISRKFNLTEKAHNGYIYARATNGIYRLPQAERIAHYALLKYLEPYVYQPSSTNPGLWKHDSRPINFTLVVDYIGIKYVGKDHALHLKAALENK